MNKLEMAHEYAIALIKNPNCHEMQMDDFVTLCNDYADKMVAEYERRKDKSRPDVLDDWQPDWSKIPHEYSWFAVDEDNTAYCYDFEPYCGELNDYWGDHDYKHEHGTTKICSSFEYQGHWTKSLRKRPE